MRKRYALLVWCSEARHEEYVYAFIGEVLGGYIEEEMLVLAPLVLLKGNEENFAGWVKRGQDLYRTSFGWSMTMLEDLEL